MSWVRMYLTVKMDRPVNFGQHYISPGSYELKFDNNQIVKFDFNESEGYKHDNDPRIVDYVLKSVELLNEEKTGPRKSIDENEFATLLLTRKIVCIEDVYIYTGEDDDLEINFESLESIGFSVYDSVQDKYMDIHIPKNLIDQYNRSL